MISRAGLRIDTVARCDYLLSRCQLFLHLRTKAPLQGQLALAFGDDDFQPTGCCGECVAKGFHHVGNFVCHTGSYPLHPDTLQSGLNVVASAKINVFKIVIMIPDCVGSLINIKSEQLGCQSSS